jgi:F-type H+-transporting ATPase subunit delta
VAMAIANRYARALADVVGRTGDYRKVLQELEDFAGAYQASGELREVLTTPAVPLPQKHAVLATILARLGVSLGTTNFLRVLAGNYRLDLLDDVIQAFVKITNDRLGIVRVEIASAAELSAAERQALLARFQSLTRKQVEVELRLEKALLGGILAQIGSTVYDGSVRGHLQRIREQLRAR